MDPVHMIGNQVDNLFCGISDSSLLHGCGIIAEPVIPVVVAIIYLKGYYDMFQPKGNTYLIPWMIVGIAMLILVGWIVFGHSKKNKK